MNALPGIAPLRCPRGILALRVPFHGLPVPTTLSRSLGPLAYSGRLSGARGALYSKLTFPSHAPSRSMDSCTPPNGFRAFFPHQQQNDPLLVNLTNPLTNITMTPGSLGWDSLLPPLIRSHHAFHIHSIHTLGPADPHSLNMHFSLFNSLTGAPHGILLTKFP